MVKPKQQKKPTQKKQQNPQNKKQGKQDDTSQFRTQVDALGLRILEVTADGNCFFRALADQLEGNEEQHRKYRSMVVKHILDNREMFEPFIEDEVPFDEYCQTMENDGTWAGHMELQAASLVTLSNICIHRNMFPRWYIRNFDDCQVRMVHLSYHDGEHYNSVRLKDDPCDGPARSIIIKADADLSAPSHQTKDRASKPYAQAGRKTFQPGSVKVVMAGSGCENREKVEQILEQVNGDVSAAIEFLIAEQGAEECSSNSDCLPSQASTNDCDENDSNEKHKENMVEDSTADDLSNSSRKTNDKHKENMVEDSTADDLSNSSRKTNDKHKENMVEDSTADDLSNSSRKTNDNITLQQNDKKIPRNKVCPCGSKKKYKACCGTSSGKQSAKFVVKQVADSRKSKRETKKGSAKAEVPCEYGSVAPDMGALCI